MKSIYIEPKIHTEKSRVVRSRVVVIKKVLIALVAIVFLGAIVLVGIRYATPLFKKVDDTKEEVAVPPITSRDARTLADEAAHMWEKDAVISRIQPVQGGTERGEASLWRAVYISATRKGKGYVVEVRKGEVTKREEVAYTQGGAEFPQNSKNESEAIEEMRKLSGFGDVSIHGVEALYNSEDHAWYWGVVTAKGTVSIRMEK